MSNEKELNFKPHYEKKAKKVSEREIARIVFGPVLSEKWSGALDTKISVI